MQTLTPSKLVRLGAHVEDGNCLEGPDELEIDPKEYGATTLYSRSWTAESVCQMLGKAISLTASDHRQALTDPIQKSKQIETLMLGAPESSIMLAAFPNNKNRFLILSGHPLLIAVKEFMDGNFSDGSPFRLEGLKVLSKLNGLTWADIQAAEYCDFADGFRRADIRTQLLRDWKSEALLHDIFFRISPDRRPLSPMGLRLSRYPGAFSDFLLSQTSQSSPLHSLLGIPAADPELRDVDLAVRFLTFQDLNTCSPLAYEGDLRCFFDQFITKMNEEFPKTPALQKRCETLLCDMQEAIALAMKIFGKEAFYHSNADGSYVGVFSRALFDVITPTLAHKKIREWAKQHSGWFGNLCIDACHCNAEFQDAITREPNSLASTVARFSEWLKIMREQFAGVAPPMPSALRSGDIEAQAVRNWR